MLISHNRLRSISREDDVPCRARLLLYGIPAENPVRRRHFWAVAAMAAAFALLTAIILPGYTVEIESGIYRWIAKFMSPGLTVAAKAVTWLCNPSTVAVVCLILVALPWSRKMIALPVCASAVASALLNHVLKQVFGRERPDILQLVEETSHSFPSGHSMTSAAVCTVLFYLVPRLVRGKLARILLSVLFLTLPLLIGVSRVYLGVHHAGDVLGGWLLGAACGLTVCARYSRWDP